MTQQPHSPRHNDDLYWRLFESAKEGILLVDGGSKTILDINRYLLNLIGASKEQLLNQKPWEIEAFQVNDILGQAFEQLKFQGYLRLDNFQVIDSTGDVREMELLISTDKADEGDIIQCRFYDNKNLKLVETERERAESSYKSLFESIQDGIAKTDITGRFTDANSAYLDMLGYSMEELGEYTFLDITPEKWRAMNSAVIKEQVLVRGYSDPYEKEYIRKDGSLVPVSMHAYDIKDASGKSIGLWAIARDITERKKAEQAIEAEQNRFKALVENISDVILIINKDGNVTYISPSVTTVAGYTPDEIIGESMLQFIHPDDRDVAYQDLLNIVQNPDQILRSDRRYLAKNGDSIIAEFISNNQLENPSVDGIVVVLRDVTEQKRDQQSLKLFRELVDQSADAIEVIDPDTLDFIDTNETSCLELGYSREEILGMSVFDIDPQITHAHVKAVEAQSRKSRSVVFESVHKRKDGSTFPVEINLKRVTIDRDYYVVSTHNLTERKLQEKYLRRINRALKTISECNAAVIHAKSEESLLNTMCRIVTETEQYLMAWIGVAESDAEKNIRPVAWHGAGTGYLQETQITWSDEPSGQGPAGRCIRTGKTQVASHIISDQDMLPWRETALKYGFKSGLALPLTSGEEVFGALIIYSEDEDAFDTEELSLLEEMAENLSFGITALRTRVAHEIGIHRLERSMEDTVQSLASTVEMRDPYTAGHQQRVANLAVAIAQEMNMLPDRIQGLSLAASIHDIGKIKLPADILNKPGELTDIEFSMIQTHAEAGYQILKDVSFPWPIAEIIRQHHERLDGSGYPQGLIAEQILPESRILAVADMVEAMSSHRPYRPARGLENTLEQITKDRGTKLDADAVDACVRLFKEKGYEMATWETK